MVLIAWVKSWLMQWVLTVWAVFISLLASEIERVPKSESIETCGDEGEKVRGRVPRKYVKNRDSNVRELEQTVKKNDEFETEIPLISVYDDEGRNEVTDPSVVLERTEERVQVICIHPQDETPRSSIEAESEEEEEESDEGELREHGESCLKASITLGSVHASPNEKIRNERLISGIPDREERSSRSRRRIADANRKLSESDSENEEDEDIPWIGVGRGTGLARYSGVQDLLAHTEATAEEPLVVERRSPAIAPRREGPLVLPRSSIVKSHHEKEHRLEEIPEERQSSPRRDGKSDDIWAHLVAKYAEDSSPQNLSEESSVRTEKETHDSSTVHPSQDFNDENMMSKSFSSQVGRRLEMYLTRIDESKEGTSGEEDAISDGTRELEEDELGQFEVEGNGRDKIFIMIEDDESNEEREDTLGIDISKKGVDYPAIERKISSPPPPSPLKIVIESATDEEMDSEDEEFIQDDDAKVPFKGDGMEDKDESSTELMEETSIQTNAETGDQNVHESAKNECTEDYSLQPLETDIVYIDKHSDEKELRDLKVSYESGELLSHKQLEVEELITETAPMDIGQLIEEPLSTFMAKEEPLVEILYEEPPVVEDSKIEPVTENEFDSIFGNVEDRLAGLMKSLESPVPKSEEEGLDSEVTEPNSEIYLKQETPKIDVDPGDVKDEPVSFISLNLAEMKAEEGTPPATDDGEDNSLLTQKDIEQEENQIELSLSGVPSYEELETEIVSTGTIASNELLSSEKENVEIDIKPYDMSDGLKIDSLREIAQKAIEQVGTQIDLSASEVPTYEGSETHIQQTSSKTSAEIFSSQMENVETDIKSQKVQEGIEKMESEALSSEEKFKIHETNAEEVEPKVVSVDTSETKDDVPVFTVKIRRKSKPIVIPEEPVVEDLPEVTFNVPIPVRRKSKGDESLRKKAIENLRRKNSGELSFGEDSPFMDEMYPIKEIIQEPSHQSEISTYRVEREIQPGSNKIVNNKIDNAEKSETTIKEDIDETYKSRTKLKRQTSRDLWKMECDKILEVQSKGNTNQTNVIQEPDIFNTRYEEFPEDYVSVELPELVSSTADTFSEEMSAEKYDELIKSDESAVDQEMTDISHKEPEIDEPESSESHLLDEVVSEDLSVTEKMIDGKHGLNNEDVEEKLITKRFKTNLSSDVGDELTNRSAGLVNVSEILTSSEQDLVARILAQKSKDDDNYEESGYPNRATTSVYVENELVGSDQSDILPTNDFKIGPETSSDSYKKLLNETELTGEIEEKPLPTEIFETTPDVSAIDSSEGNANTTSSEKDLMLNLIRLERDSGKRTLAEGDIPDYLEEVKDLLVPRARRKKAKNRLSALSDILKVDEPEESGNAESSQVERNVTMKSKGDSFDETAAVGDSKKSSLTSKNEFLLTEEECRELDEIRKEQEAYKEAQRKELEKYLSMPDALTEQEQTELEELLAEEESDKALTAASEARLEALLAEVRQRLGDSKTDLDDENLDRFMDLPAGLTEEEERMLRVGVGVGGEQETEKGVNDFETEDEYRDYIRQRYLDQLEEERLRVEEEEIEFGAYFDDDYDYDDDDDFYDDEEYDAMEAEENAKSLLDRTMKDEAVGCDDPMQDLDDESTSKKSKTFFSLSSLRSSRGSSSRGSKASLDKSSKESSREGSVTDEATKEAVKASKKFFRYGSLGVKRKKKSSGVLGGEILPHNRDKAEVKEEVLPREEVKDRISSETELKCDRSSSEDLAFSAMGDEPENRRSPHPWDSRKDHENEALRKTQLSQIQLPEDFDKPSIGNGGKALKNLNNRDTRNIFITNAQTGCFAPGTSLDASESDWEIIRGDEPFTLTSNLPSTPEEDDFVVVQIGPPERESRNEREQDAKNDTNKSSLINDFIIPAPDGRGTGDASQPDTNRESSVEGELKEVPFQAKDTEEITMSRRRDFGRSSAAPAPAVNGGMFSKAREEELWPEKTTTTTTTTTTSSKVALEEFEQEVILEMEKEDKKKRSGDKKTKKKKKKKSDGEKENEKTAYQNKEGLLEKHVGPRIRSFDAAKMKNKFNKPKEPTQVSTDCRICGKQVFQMEKIVAEKASWHKNCFRCKECNKSLTLETYQSHEGSLYCKPHFKELFRPKAVVQDEAQERKDRLMRRPRMIVLESKPEALPDDVVRATDKPDYGLEELQQTLNVKQRFSMFENLNKESEQPQTEPISVRRSNSLMSKAARFLDGHEDGEAEVDFGDEEMESEEGDEEEEGEGEEGEVNHIVRSNRKRKERPMSFSGMGDLKAVWEQKQRREEMSQSRKEEIAKFRQLLCAGKNSILKEKFESGAFEDDEEGEEGGRRPKEEIKIEGKRAASSLMKKFERGQPFILEDEEDDEEESGEEEEGEEGEEGVPRRRHKRRFGSEKQEVEEIFREAETAKAARNVFKQIDSHVAQEGGGGPILRSQSFASANRENRRSLDASLLMQQNQSLENVEVVKSDEKNDDYQVDTTDLATRFRFFLNYEKEKEKERETQRKVFRITPPRDGTDEGMQGTEDPDALGRDPNLIKCTDNYQDDVDCRNTKNILQMFRKMEMGDEEEEEDEGPRPLKRFTPPPDAGEYEDESEEEYSDEEYSDEEEEDDEEGDRRPQLRDELLLMKADRSQSARKAANLRAKFEKWEVEMGRRNDPNSDKDKDELEEAMPSLDTAKNLRAMFEHKANEVTKPVASKPIAQKINRFV